jgi:hypothetical protein
MLKSFIKVGVFAVALGFFASCDNADSTTTNEVEATEVEATEVETEEALVVEEEAAADTAVVVTEAPAN